MKISYYYQDTYQKKEKNEINFITNNVKNLLKPRIESLSTDSIKHEQMNDDVLSVIRYQINERNSNKEINQRLTPDIAGNRAMKSYHDRLPQLRICPKTKLIYFHEEILPGKRRNTTQKICLPLSQMMLAFKEAHTDTLAGHQGITQTFEKIDELFFFPGLHKWVKMLIADCAKCQESKSTRNNSNNFSINTSHQLSNLN